MAIFVKRDSRGGSQNGKHRGLHSTKHILVINTIKKPIEYLLGLN